MDTGDIQQESNNNELQQNLHTTCRVENISTSFQSLDTVRALHHTVVSLRLALEEAKFEIQRLRTQISKQTDIQEGVKNQNQQLNRKPYIPKIAQPTKQLRFDLQNNNTDKNDESNFSSIRKDKCLKKSSPEKTEKPKFQLDIPEYTETTITSSNFKNPYLFKKSKQNTKAPQIQFKNNSRINEAFHTQKSDLLSPEKKNYTVNSYPLSSTDSDSSIEQPDKSSKVPDEITINKTKNCSNKNKSTDCDKMTSKIDLKIKVTSNIKVVDSNSDEQNNKENTSPTDTDQPQASTSVCGKKLYISNEDNLTVRQGNDGNYIISQTSKENINIEEDDISEGDNSVFEKSEKQDSKNQVNTQEPKEECDDIELIFSSDANRDPIQEEMISLSEYDPWKAGGGSGTPVLIKFSSLQSDQDSPSLPSLDDDSNTGQMQTSSTFDEFSAKINNNATVTQEKAIDGVENFSYITPVIKSTTLERNNSENQRHDSRSTLGRDNFFYHQNNTSGDNGCYAIERGYRKWTNCNILVETDISKCGIAEENNFELYQRRNTCPNPPAYRPMMHRDPPFVTRPIPSRLASKYSRRIQQFDTSNLEGENMGNRIFLDGKINCGPKRSSSAQTEISALPELWKSECHLAGNRYHIGGPCTLPSKFVPIMRKSCQKNHNRNNERNSTEARRILLSDINFTSMVPELSRSADHLCQDENNQDEINKQHQHQHEIKSGYYKGNLLKTPDYILKGITPSTSITSPGLSQWTVNENSFGTQTIQTGESWGGKRGDSLDSCRSYTIGSKTSGLDKHHRSRSVPSVHCVMCRQIRAGGNNNATGIRTSESMNYTPRVTFKESTNKIRSSLPDLRHDCVCSHRYTSRAIITIHGESSGSTESLLEEADSFIRKSLDGNHFKDDALNNKRLNFRRMSENDVQKDYIPSKMSLPFLPKTANCLKPGHLVKVITKTGRVVVGRVRYVGPLVSTKTDSIDENNYSKTPTTEDLYVGIQLQSKCGDCDGTFDGRIIFECEPFQGLFVPFKKVIMAWTT